METYQAVAVDPGFGGFKAATIHEGQPVAAMLPSVVGVGQVDMGLLSNALGQMGRRGRRAEQEREPDQVSFGGVTYLIGDGVSRYAEPVDRMDMRRLADGPELRALFYGALTRLLKPGEHRVALAIGLPVEVMTKTDLAHDVLRVLRGWCVDQHHFTVNGQETTLQILDILPMAQPVGSFFAWGMDGAGKWVRATGDLKAPVGICDIGYNTVDLFGVQGGQVIGRYTEGDTRGIRRAAELLAQNIRGRYDMDLARPEATALLRAKQPTLNTPEGEVNVAPLVRQAIENAGASIISFVEQRWKEGRQFAYLLFTGGGAELLREMLLRNYPHGIVLPEPVTANAVGLAKYAQRAGVFKVE